MLGIINKQASLYNITKILGVTEGSLYICTFESKFDPQNMIVGGIDTRGKNTVLMLERRDKEEPYTKRERYVYCPLWNKGKLTIAKITDVAVQLYSK